MMTRYIPYLSWQTKNIAYTLLYTVFKHNMNGRLSKKDLQKLLKKLRSKLDSKNSPRVKARELLISRLRNKKIKNNQFNIKWNFNKYLKFYYKDIKPSHLFSTETRLDIILFRTNWFINKEAVKTAIKKGLITYNNKRINFADFIAGYIHLKSGDIIKFTPANKHDIKLYLTSHFSYTPKNIVTSSQHITLTNKSKKSTNINKIYALMDWYKNYKRNLIPNMSYLEINNNIKALTVLKTPKYNEIPYSFNLRKFRN